MASEPAVPGAGLYADAVRLRLATGSEVTAYVRVAGDGTPRPKCLLIHGNPGCLLDWSELVPQLFAFADLAACDLPGFGQSARSAPGPASLSLERLAAETVAVAAALGWNEPVILVGHSHGGGVAQTAAARFPERVAALVLISSLGYPAHESYRLLSLPGAELFARLVGWLFRAPAFRSLSRHIVRGVLRDVFFPEPVPAARLERELASFAARPEVLTSMVAVTLGRPSPQLLAQAPKIGCPTRFLHGASDALIPIARVQALHERISSAGGDSQLEVVANAGHSLPEFQTSAVVRAISAVCGR